MLASRSLKWRFLLSNFKESRSWPGTFAKLDEQKQQTSTQSQILWAQPAAAAVAAATPADELGRQDVKMRLDYKFRSLEFSRAGQAPRCLVHDARSSRVVVQSSSGLRRARRAGDTRLRRSRRRRRGAEIACQLPKGRAVFAKRKFAVCQTTCLCSWHFRRFKALVCSR